jgi:hypothetical protein
MHSFEPKKQAVSQERLVVLYLDQKKRQAELDRKKEEKKEQELKACTFQPKLNRKKS